MFQKGRDQGAPPQPKMIVPPPAKELMRLSSPSVAPLCAAASPQRTRSLTCPGPVARTGYRLGPATA